MVTYETFMKQWRDSSRWIEAHTSGSTGQPNVIRLLKSDMEASAKATNAFFGITRDSVLGLPLSMDYIAGKMMAVRAFVAGCRMLQLDVSNRFDLPERVDLLSVVPSQLPHVLQSFTPAQTGRLLVGGAPVDEATETEVVNAGFEAYIGYGMTETCSHVALRRFGSGPVYDAMDGISFDIDEDSCLAVCSNRFSWKRLQTNDIVRLHSDNAFEWLGRRDNIINSGGIKVPAEQAESLLRTHIPTLPPFYIVGEPDERWGTRVAMVAECGESEASQIKELLAKVSLPKGWRPGAVYCIAALPRTSNGKIRRLPVSRIC